MSQSLETTELDLLRTILMLKLPRLATWAKRRKKKTKMRRFGSRITEAANRLGLANVIVQEIFWIFAFVPCMQSPTGPLTPAYLSFREKW